MNARLRISASDGDLLALGRATYVFAYLEWQVVWCLEKLKPGYVQSLKKKTAGQIASDFVKAVQASTDQAIVAALLAPAKRFVQLVGTRNGIMHGKPGTADGGSQLLFREGTPWTQAKLEAAADDFADCAIDLNAHFHGVLGGP